MIHWGRYLGSVVLLLLPDIHGFKEVELRKKLRGPLKASVPSVRGATVGWCPPECKDTYLWFLEIIETLMEFLD